MDKATKVKSKIKKEEAVEENAAQRLKYPTLNAVVHRNRYAEAAVQNLEALGYDQLAKKVSKEVGGNPMVAWQKEFVELAAAHPEIAEYVEWAEEA